MQTICEVEEFLGPTHLQAQILRSDDGRPVRPIINGRQRKWTGKYFCLKAGAQSMPWESRKCELPLLKLAEASSAVVALLAQPHCLRMTLEGKRFDYYPDLELTVLPSFLKAYHDGASFCRALVGWAPATAAEMRYAKVIVEAKDDSDRRMADPEYLLKLDLAKQAYRNLGFHMVTVMRSTDLDPLDFADLHSVLRFRLARFTAVDEIGAVSLLRDAAHVSLLDVCDALGGWRRGRAKAYALHCRRLISIDLATSLSAFTRVRPMPREISLS